VRTALRSGGASLPITFTARRDARRRELVIMDAPELLQRRIVGEPHRAGNRWKGCPQVTTNTVNVKGVR
jgi:hypothetical protein